MVVDLVLDHEVVKTCPRRWIIDGCSFRCFRSLVVVDFYLQFKVYLSFHLLLHMGLNLRYGSKPSVSVISIG